jgi:predicted permease
VIRCAERNRPFAAIQVEGQPPFQQGTGGMVVWRFVTPGYFSTLNIPIIRGRKFTEQDRTSGESTIILSNSLSRKLFPDGDALGQQLRIDNHSWTVIGVADDVRNNGPSIDTSPEYYMLRKPTLDATFRNQMPPSGWRQARIAIQTPVNSKLMAGWLTTEIAAVDPSLPVAISTMEQRINRLADRPRFNAMLLALYAGVGLLLASIGLYGVMSFVVGQRTQEIGVRMALGATPRAIIRLVMSRAAAWTLGGALVGLIGSLYAVRALRSLLFQVPERDPWSFAVVLPVLFVVALAAAWVPARRASRVDPMTALHHE